MAPDTGKSPLPSIGPLIKVISEALARNGNRDLEREGLTFTQMLALDELSRDPAVPLRQSQLAAAMHVSHPTVVGVVRRMEEKGLVGTAPSPDDRRVSLVSLTPLGREAWEKSLARRSQTDEIMFRGLSAEEAQTLHDLLERVLANLLDAETGSGAGAGERAGAARQARPRRQAAPGASGRVRGEAGADDGSEEDGR